MNLIPLTPERVLDVLWLVWWASWMLAAFWRDRAAKRPPQRQEILYRLLTIGGIFLLFGLVHRRAAGEMALWRTPAVLGWALVVVGLAGLAFTWWARIHLGRLWSSSVTRKADHHVVDTGPYAIVRHPIYTGVTTATLALAALRGTVQAWLGFALLTFGWYVKARVEEGFLRAELGAEAYDGYARRVPMLVPFLPPRR